MDVNASMILEDMKVVSSLKIKVFEAVYVKQELRK